MKTRAAVTVLASVLTLSAVGATAATNSNVALTNTLAAYSKATLTETLAQGSLEQHLTSALETAPSAEQVLTLRQTLASIASTAPGDAAAASQALINSAWTTAASDPQLGIDVAAIAVDVVSDSSTTAAAPETAAQALADVSGVVTLAQRVADERGITLSGTDIADKARQVVAADASLQSVAADFDTRVADAIQLAEAQAELTDFSTAFSFGFPSGFTLRTPPAASPATPSFGFSF